MATLRLGPPAPDGDIRFAASALTTLWFMYLGEGQLRYGRGSVRGRLAVVVRVLSMTSLEQHWCVQPRDTIGAAIADIGSLKSVCSNVVEQVTHMRRG